uniref:hypothetical protein n=1 Tax=uncultured Dubosiella sp. TaxID=1937011 RepID=UPI0032B262D8
MNEKNLKNPKVYKMIVIFFSLIILALAGYFIYQIQNLQVLPNNLLIPICVVIGLVVLILLALWNYYQHLNW